MQKIIFITLLSVIALANVHAQTDTPGMAKKLNVGQVDVDFQKAALTPGVWHLMGRVKLNAQDYDLSAEDIEILFNASSRKTGAAALRQAVARSVPGQQVIAHIRRPLESQAYTIYADQAIFVPDTTRPSGGKADFTGHVKVITESGFLSVPSVTTVEGATVLLGAGRAYPQVSTGPGHITLTPAQ